MHRFMVLLEPWGIGLAVFGLLVTLAGFMLDLEDRQSERTFRAWEIISMTKGERSGSAVRQALVYLNREFKGRICGKWVINISVYLSGNDSRRCVIPKKPRESFRFIEIQRAVLYKADLRKANLYGSNLSKADLNLADLNGAKLDGANLSEAKLSGANLGGATLSQANLWGVDLRMADLSGADLNGANLDGANLGRANLSQADLIEADLGRANLSRATLRKANFIKADLSGADLSLADLSLADLSGVRNLTQAQIDSACIQKDLPLPELPDGLNPPTKICPLK